ncbi:MAG: hypothetical protein LBD18_01185, partial [Treponema sp.]|nr:hypothetical protein [Treponema sp.]
MKKDVWNGVALLLVAIAVLALSGCPVDSSDSTDNGTETPKDSVGLKSVTINGVAVDIGFKGTAGFAGSEGWGF